MGAACTGLGGWPRIQGPLNRSTPITGPTFEPDPGLAAEVGRVEESALQFAAGAGNRAIPDLAGAGKPPGNGRQEPRPRVGSQRVRGGHNNFELGIGQRQQGARERWRGQLGQNRGRHSSLPVTPISHPTYRDRAAAHSPPASVPTMQG
jgi:hypothetical protein